MNTTENNKKIAEFMGAKIKGNPILNEYEMYGIIECIEDGENEQHHFIPQEMKFSASWDWLMEVVEKINLIDDYKYTVIIKSMDVQIYNNVSGKIIFESECKWQPDELLKSVYEAIISFIDWYNKNGAKEK